MDAEVWSLNLDQIEPHGGRVLQKVYVEAEKLGPSTFPFEARTVLYSKLRPYLNKVVVADEPGFATTELVPLRCNPDEVHPEYLAYFLRSEEFLRFATEVVAGAKMPRMVMTAFWDFQISLPPIAEQRRIAAILDQADTLRTKRREALSQLDSLTQSIFIEMFGEPTSNPKGWKIQSLLESCDQINDCPHSTPKWTEFGEIGLRTSNLTEGGWNWDDTRYVSEETFHERSKRGYVTTGDIILSREGTVGIAAIVTAGMKVCMGQRLVQVRPNYSLLSSEFLLRHLLFVLSPQRIGQLMVGSTSQHLNVKELKAMKIPLPPVSLQLEFSKITESLDILKKTALDSLTEIDNLFASLQHCAFRGEL